jgi:hypothetical protein
MATNWLPTTPYPSWAPAELGGGWLSFSDLQTAIQELSALGFTKANPTAQENQDYFQQVRCDEGHPCSGIMIVSPLGVRYPFAYCTGATHKSALVLWVVGYTMNGDPSYDLGWGSGVIAP